jgi:hypothetical protein
MIWNTPLNGEIECEKAEFFYSKITDKGDFNASADWLAKFKQKYRIHINWQQAVS